MMVATEQLKKLFQAFRNRNDAAFYQAAEALIAEELAANHHSFATDLKKALGSYRELTKNSGNSFTLLPKDRRNGEELITLHESSVDTTKIILSQETQVKIQRVLDEHHKRKLLARYGYTPKTKLLFWGSPGCGKTFTANYLAYELGLPVGVLQLSAVISSFVGDTASHLQRVFNLANNTPMVLLLDEVDAVGKNRDDPNDVGELKRVVNSLLQAMDTFRSSESVIIAASNPALWRRFDDIIHFPIPDKTERELYLKTLLNGVNFDGSLANLSKNMSSFSYAEIKTVTVEGIKTMILEGRESLQSSDILEQIRAYKKATNEAKSRHEAVINE